MEAMYTSFVLTVCTNLIVLNNANEPTNFALILNLIVKCAIDLLPLATLPGHGGMQELLLNCALSPSRAGDEQEGKHAQEAGSASTGEQSATDSNTPISIQLLRQETLAHDWVERVMLCYKEFIADTTIRSYVRRLLSTLVPAWPAEMLRRINDRLVADLTELANAASTLTDARDIATDHQKAEAVARAVVRELRPLAIVDQVPVMLAVLVESHGETACVAAAEEALQAVNCRQLPEKSKPLAACLSEIDSIVLGHQEAIKRSKTKTPA